MELTEKVQDLENQVKLLKNEIHQTLLDIKDRLADDYQPAPQMFSEVTRPREGRAFPGEEPGPKVEPVERPAERPQAQQAVGGGHVVGAVGGVGGIAGYQPGPSASNEGPGPPAEFATPGRTEPAPRVEPQESPVERTQPQQAASEMPSALIGQQAPVFTDRNSNGNGKPGGGPRKVDDEINLAILATLGNWADRSARKIGRERVEAILEVYQLTGHLPRNLKEVLLKLLGLDDAPVAQSGVSLRECITVLLELNGLLVGHSRTEAAMLGLLVNGHQSCAGG